MAHIDPVTGDLVSCETTYVGPIYYAKNLERLVKGHPELSLSDIAQKLDKDELWLKRQLYILKMSEYEIQDMLINEFLEQLHAIVSSIYTENHDKVIVHKGRMKAVIKEMIEFMLPKFSDASFRATDSNESPSRIRKDSNIEELKKRYTASGD